ncbi:NAD(P)/FAD-dependent oxidoreductase [Kiloniella sp. b19]|uniref:NAD(P)/FAD-dependent oxidoreductase n=1 Tax=Kiloniella sp. GXU_MW_B19 TaxID=3141326 RepID=UPI0031DEECCF
MTADREPDVIVVGGGIVGICSALSLAEAGQSVLLLDRDEPGQGASFGNAGVISPWSVVPQGMPGLWKSIPGMLLNPDGAASIAPRHALNYLPWLMRFLKDSAPDRVREISRAMFLLCGDSVALYRHHLQGTGQEHLLQDSMYVHAYRNVESATLNSLGARLRQDKGAELEVVDGAALREIEPAISPDFRAAVLIKGQARSLDSGLIGKTLARKLSEMGGEIRQVSVETIQPSGEGWQVITKGEILSAAKVVVSAGAWSAKLLEPLGMRLPLAFERGYHVSFEGAGVVVNNTVMDAESHVVANDMACGLRLAGIAEFAGPDTPPNERRIKTLVRKARALFPAIRTEKMSEWMGVRPSFPDSLPVLEHCPGHKGLFAAFGHSHYGMMMAPRTGQLVANLVTGKIPNEDLSPFSSSRF